MLISYIKLDHALYSINYGILQQNVGSQGCNYRNLL